MRFLALLPLFCAAAQTHDASLEQSLKRRVADFPGTVSLYAKNLDSGAEAGIRPADPVRTASTIKLTIMLAVFDAVARGQAKWTEPLTITAADKVSGSGVLGTEFSEGDQLPLRDVMHLMIVLSDNTATNMILGRITADAVNANLDRIGIHTTRSLRKVLGEGQPSGFSAAGRLPENRKYGIGVSTPRDMVAILEKLERGEIVSPEASREMIAVLKRCQDSTGMRRSLKDMPIANKTGALDALRSELGIAYSKGGRIAMSITVDGIPQPDWTPDNPGSLLIADLAKMLVEGLASRPKPALAANSLAENSFAIWRFRRYNGNLAGVGLLE
ncbi:MAG TPA: serine hydrolase [Bryobacteraceae bacterium]|nr:serine hydrolase [Bryobacteraceae bacterium]